MQGDHKEPNPQLGNCGVDNWFVGGPPRPPLLICAILPRGLLSEGSAPGAAAQYRRQLWSAASGRVIGTKQMCVGA